MSATRIKEVVQTPSWGRQTALLCLLCVLGLWAYWPAIKQMVAVWSAVDDYSHAFLVPPLAVFILWSRRDSRPQVVPKLRASGIILLAAAALLQIAAGKYFIEAFDGWSLVIWIAGAVCLFGGWPLLRWALPAVGFLFFMVPLPFRLETALSVPLQRIATIGSSWLLQLLGQPALPEGTRIVLGETPLEIERACSGLRMFFGVFALAYVYSVFSHRPWWDKAAILLSTVPIAILANLLRITATGLLYQISDSPQLHHVIHDSAGWITILVAAAMLGMFSWYLRHLLQEVQLFEGRDLVHVTHE